MSTLNKGILLDLIASLVLLLAVDAIRQDNGPAALTAALTGLLLAVWGDILVIRGIRENKRKESR